MRPGAWETGLAGLSGQSPDSNDIRPERYGSPSSDVFFEECIVWDRLGEIVTLQTVNPVFSQNFYQLSRFYAFRTDIGAIQRSNSVEVHHQLPVLLVIREILDKAAVYLDSFNLDVTEQTQGGKTCPKIVDRKVHAKGAQGSDDILQPDDIQSPATFGDLQAEVPARESGFLKKAHNRIYEIIPLDLCVGQINIQHEVWIPVQETETVCHGLL